MAHNGGRSQLNFDFLQVGGEYPFINHLKTAQAWDTINGLGLPEPLNFDSNGYPTAIAVGSGGYYTVFFIPTQTSRPGNWIIKWIGNGTVYTGFGRTIVSGSLTGTDGRCVITPTDSAWSTSGSLRIVFGISAIGANPITSLAFIHESEEASYDAGNVFSSYFKTKLSQGNCGVYRFLNWQYANTSFAAKWAERKPLNYVFYDGPEFRSSIYAGATTNVADDYSASLAGFVLADKALVIVKFNASSTGTAPTLNVQATGAKTIKDWFGDVLSVANNTKPVADHYAALRYDADLDCWVKHGGDVADGSQMLHNGIPPELCVQLCNEMGAHPWLHVPYLALDPKTDYATQLATYARDQPREWVDPSLRAGERGMEQPLRLQGDAVRLEQGECVLGHKPGHAQLVRQGAFHRWAGRERGLRGMTAAAIR
jgi:hypothetical protein